jgi:hypothetical protein
VIANRGCGDVADLRISERRKNGFQVTFFGLVIAVGLDHEVVIFIAPVIVEIGQVALLALHPPRKIQVVIFRDSLAAGDRDTMLCTPGPGFFRWIFVGDPGVMGKRIVFQHTDEGPPGDRPGLRRSLSHNHGHPPRFGDLYGQIGLFHPANEKVSVSGHQKGPTDDEGVKEKSDRIKNVGRPAPPHVENGRGKNLHKQAKVELAFLLRREDVYENVFILHGINGIEQGC